MTRLQKIAIGAATLAAVFLTGGAVAATKLASPEQESKAVVNDAARRLGVTPQRLTEALKEAMKSRIDDAVKSGRLPEADANRIKARIDANALPFLGPGSHGRRGFGHRGSGFHHGLQSAAQYLGMTEEQLRTALVGGKTLAELARDHDKPIDGLVDALVADKRERIEQSVRDGQFTRAQADRFLQELETRITEMVNGRMPTPPAGKFRGGFGHGIHPDRSGFHPAF